MNQVFATLHASPQTVYAVCAGLDVCLSLSHFSLILCDVLSYPLSAIPVCIPSLSPPCSHCMINSQCCRG